MRRGIFQDISGKRFGRLLVVEIAPSGRQHGKRTLWLCRCVCGTSSIVDITSLRSGTTKSCGCLARESARNLLLIHDGKGTRLYGIWCGMIGRCERTSNNRYRVYGARGICVCNEWRHDFAKFRTWALSHGYADDLTIDRINNEGDYSPSNCQWLTREANVSKARREQSARRTT